MRSLKPLTVANWLLDKFGYGNHALAGDLLEEFSEGRSVAWYWRQVLVAIAVGLAKEVRGHKLLALRAIAAGWAARYFILYVVAIPWWRFFDGVLLAHGLKLGPSWWRHYYLYPGWLIECFFAASSGWFVGRLHRGHREAMVLAFLLTVQISFLPEFFRLTVDVLGDRRFLPYLLTLFVEFIFVTVGTLLGGLWNVPRERPISSD